MIPIICPIYYGNRSERREYFKKHIESVNQFHQLADIHFIFFAEPDSEPLLNFIPATWKTTIIHNQFQHNLPFNFYQSLHYGFEVKKFDYVFFLEDDVICSQDTPILIHKAAQNGWLNTHILCLLNKHHHFHPNDVIYESTSTDSIIETHNIGHLSGWGCGIGAKFWFDIMKPNWSMNSGFDTALTNKFTTLPILTPRINRLNHIGETGYHYTKSQYDEHNFKSIVVASVPDKNINYKIDLLIS